MKKVLSLVLVLTLVLGSFSFAFAAPSDVVGTEYEDAVARLEQLKVLEGYPDGTFKPANTITRAEFAAVVVRVKGLEAAAQAAKGTTVFTDVPATNWASGYVNIASKMNFVKGMGDGTFAPNSPVTYEQAVTMVIRALGYEPAAEARGGYPYGYLIVANENGLLDAVKGVQGLPAPRGLVAQLVDNALEIPQMIQVGYGAQTKWVVSGTEDTEERLLLDDLGFAKIAKERVTEINPDKNQIRLEKAGWKKVAAGFDFEAVHGLRLNAWLDGSGKVAVFTKVDAPKYDATTYSASDEKIKLVNENVKYVVADKATLLLDNESVDADEFVAHYAKVVLNADDEIIWAKGYTFDEVLVVDEVKDEIAYGYDSDEVDLEDYTIVKDGKTIAIDDLEENDILFYNTSEDFALVYNNSKTGEIERVYSNEFKLGGKVYKFDDSSKAYDAKYLDGNEIGSLNQDALDGMMDEESTVEVFFAMNGEVVLVVGNRGVAATNSFYGWVTADTVTYNGRSGQMWSLDVRNEEGKVVNFDLKNNFVINKKSDGTTLTGDDRTFIGGTWTADNPNTTTVNEANPAKNAPVRVTLNDDGVPTKVELLSTVATGKLDAQGNPAAASFKITATYARALVGGNEVDYRLQPETLVFYGNKVVALKDAESAFTVVESGNLYVEKGRVIAVFAATTNEDSDTTLYKGLVTRVRTLTSGAKEVTLEVFGETKVFLTGTTSTEVGYVSGVAAGQVVSVKVGNKTEKIAATVTPETKLSSVTVESRNTGDRTITEAVYGQDSNVYELNKDAVVYNKASNGTHTKINLRDLQPGDTVDIYTDAASSRYVNYVVRTALAPAGGNGGNNNANITASHATTTLTVNVANVTGAFAVRVYDVDSGNAIGGFQTLSNGTATISNVAANPVFITVKVYDNANKLLLEKVITVQ